MKGQFKIGQKVGFSLSYPRKCSHRFLFKSNSHDFDHLNICKNCGVNRVSPLLLSNCDKVKPFLQPNENDIRSGYVVGLRHVIMEDYEYHHERDPEMGSSSYATGKVERVLLVSENIRREPFIVRFKDVI